MANSACDKAAFVAEDMISVAAEAPVRF